MIPHQVSNVFKQYGALALCTSVLGYEMQLNFPVAQIKRDGGLLNSHDCLYIAKETQNSSCGDDAFLLIFVEMETMSEKVSVGLCESHSLIYQSLTLLPTSPEKF